MQVRNKKTGEVFESLGSPNDEYLRIVKDGEIVYLENASDYEPVRYRLPLHEWVWWTTVRRLKEDENAKYYVLNYLKDTNGKQLIPGDDATEFFFQYIHSIYGKVRS